MGSFLFSVQKPLPNCLAMPLKIEKTSCQHEGKKNPHPHLNKLFYRKTEYFLSNYSSGEYILIINNILFGIKKKSRVEYKGFSPSSRKKKKLSVFSEPSQTVRLQSKIQNFLSCIEKCLLQGLKFFFFFPQKRCWGYFHCSQDLQLLKHLVLSLS